MNTRSWIVILRFESSVSSLIQSLLPLPLSERQKKKTELTYFILKWLHLNTHRNVDDDHKTTIKKTKTNAEIECQGIFSTHTHTHSNIGLAHSPHSWYAWLAVNNRNKKIKKNTAITTTTPNQLICWFQTFE